MIREQVLWLAAGLSIGTLAGFLVSTLVYHYLSRTPYILKCQKCGDFVELQGASDSVAWQAMTFDRHHRCGKEVGIQ